MSVTVFFRPPEGPRRATEHIATQPAEFREALVDASEQLADTGRVEGQAAFAAGVRLDWE